MRIKMTEAVKNIYKTLEAYNHKQIGVIIYDPITEKEIKSYLIDVSFHNNHGKEIIIEE